MRPSKISLSQIEALCAVAKYRSFKHAAHNLGISQPSLITKISNLEELYGTKLFLRRRQNNQLTTLGAELLPIFQSALNNVREAEFLLFSHDRLLAGEIHIAAVSPYQVSRVLKKLHVLYPNIKVKVTFSASSNIQKLLETGEVDAAFYVQTEKKPGQQSYRYYDYRIVAIVPNDHGLSSKKILQLEDFANQKYISREPGSLTRSMFDDALCEQGVTVNCVYELGSRESIREAVGQGMGISVVAENEHVPHENIVLIPIASNKLHMSSSLVVLNERISSPLTKALIDAVASLSEGRP